MLGRGAMGEAWLARRAADGQPVVAVADPAALADAERRARPARVGHACSSRTSWRSSAWTSSTSARTSSSSSSPAMALHALLRRLGRLPWSDAARVARDLAPRAGRRARAGRRPPRREARQRDRAPDGAATLVDFGLAKDRFATSVTSPQMILGTAAYMAPEQGRRGDARRALRPVRARRHVYELVAGAPPPGAGQDLAAVEEAATTGDYAPLEEAASGCWPAGARRRPSSSRPTRPGAIRADLVA
ncbi:MAG: hypothetical protein KIT58_01265 [Planctomycetota bacterium]|nr:hypothetical protein [Planctomycetota bacterium]